MFESVATLRAEHEQLQQQLGDPALHADPARAKKVNRRYAEDFDSVILAGLGHFPMIHD